MDMWVPQLKKIKKIKAKQRNIVEFEQRTERKLENRKIFKKFSLFVSLFNSQVSNRQNSLGQTRKVLYSTRATREYQKNEISPRIQVNIPKIIVFRFSQIYGVLLVP